MSPESLRDAYRAFMTTGALVTTDRPRGPNVMVAEWIFHIPHEPFLVSVHIDRPNG